MTTRIVSGAAAVLLALVFVAGCGSNAPPPTNSPPPTETTNRTSTPGGSANTASDGRPDAIAAAREFLTSTDKGTPDLAKITPAFKQLIAPPTTEADKARGYSEWGAEQWLNETLSSKFKTTVMAATSITPEIVIVTASDSIKGNMGQVVSRLIKTGSAWLVDWVHVAPQQERFRLGESGDNLASAFVANAFLDTLLTGQHALTESLLTPTAKARLAPPLNDPLGYNRAMLGVKLAGFRGKATEWKASGGDASVTGQLIEPGPKERAFTLKLVKGTRPSEWLVDDFDVK